MNTINLNKPGELDVQVAFPSTWDEMLPDEIFSIAKLIIHPPDNDVESKSSLLLSILAVRIKDQGIKMPKKWQQLLNAEDLVRDVFPLLNFIYDENVLTVLPFKSIHLPGHFPYTVHAPAKGFESLTCGEYEVTEQCFHEFLDTSKVEPLARLVSVIFRHESPKFQRRDKDGLLITYPYERWAKRFEDIEPYKLYSIFIWYSGCRNALPKYFPVVHEVSAEVDEEAKNAKMQFTNCIHAGAGTKNGTRDNIRLMQLLEFYHDMEQEAEKAKATKEEYERHSK